MQNNVKFCEVYNLSHTIRKSTKKNDTFPNSAGFTHEKKLYMKFGFFGKFCFFLKVFSIVLLISWI